MLETARTGARVGSLQECSSIGRAPVSKTGGRRFEPCHSCHLDRCFDRSDLVPLRRPRCGVTRAPQPSKFGFSPAKTPCSRGEINVVDEMNTGRSKLSCSL